VSVVALCDTARVLNGTRRVGALRGALITTVLAAGLFAGAAAMSAAVLPTRQCASSDFALSRTPGGTSEKTMQLTLRFTLRNVSASACVVRGYPAVAFIERGGRTLGFAYRHEGDEMVTDAPPRLVSLRPGEPAYFALNKNDCVTHSRGIAIQFRVTPPHDTRALSEKTDLTYCAAGDPGHVIDVTPIEATPRAVFTQPGVVGTPAGYPRGNRS
jgi:hypothetical protein